MFIQPYIESLAVIVLNPKYLFSKLLQPYKYPRLNVTKGGSYEKPVQV